MRETRPWVSVGNCDASVRLYVHVGKAYNKDGKEMRVNRDDRVVPS